MATELFPRIQPCGLRHLSHRWPPSVSDPAAVDAPVDAYERQSGPRNGARVVAGDPSL